MRHSKEFQTIDGIADSTDQFQVETQQRSNGLMLYVHTNGQTILRIGQILHPINFTHNGQPFGFAKPSYLADDLAELRDRFSNCIAVLPAYKRRDVWAFVQAMEKRLEEKDREISQLADAYDRGERAGYSRAHSRPGDGDMGG